MWLVLITVWCLTSWSQLRNVTFVNVSSITSIFTCKDNVFPSVCFMFDQLDFLYECFTYSQYVVCIHSVRNGIYCWIRLFLLAKTWFMLIYSRLLYLMRASAGGWRLEWLWKFIPMIIWKSRLCFVKFLIFFDCYLAFTNFSTLFIYLSGSTICL